MHTLTDYIIVIVLILSFYSGWCKGFLRTLFGPMALILGCLGGIIYYAKNQNFIIGLLISILGPFAIYILLTFLFKFFQKTMDKNKFSFSWGRLGGGLLHLSWRAVLIGFLLILIVIVPAHFTWLKKIQNNIMFSQSYTFLYTLAGNRIPVGTIVLKKIIDAYQDPHQFSSLQSSKEFKTLTADEHFKEFLADQKTVKQIQEKNFSQLLVNPKVHSVLQDKELLKKLFAFYKEMVKQSIGENNKTQPSVKIINIPEKILP